MFLFWLELVIIGVLLLLFVSQVFLPLWRNTPIFPLFRRERKLEAEIAEVKQQGLEADLKKELQRLKRGRVNRGETPGKVSRLPGVKKDNE
ncbi:hypothetical protein A3B18_00870 [Candidatus Giovannonibacteria bacterium RIFCSPLOWO2_01_FULL_46_13]|uniref:Uncharacterized protein n=1 Tax=Candidatus Giovannonibacteria bacterium RIFCSPLOWO2_01_FULL_46_13 TaxID=1798352 RepID=A0A1F5X4N1_9BACT|nr:MAG: hypothetical protein A3B18_00870 [Candidatus Giovannonibacteria bacterium RIFCSPLOWO2_01_FULL_46_13]